jgi:hypothetical protein
LCSRLASDPNLRIRLGLTLAAGGDPEGGQILASMVAQTDKWVPYLRGLCLRYGIDPEPILSGLR